MCITKTKKNTVNARASADLDARKGDTHGRGHLLRRELQKS